MFYAEILDRDLAYWYWSSLENGASVGTGSTDTTINISNGPPENISPTYKTIIFLSGQNAGYGSSIVSYTAANGSVTSVVVADPFITPPSQGDQFLIVDMVNRYYLFRHFSMYAILEGSASYKSDMGCDTMTCTMRPISYTHRETWKQRTGSVIRVYDMAFTPIWEGIITSNSKDGETEKIEAVGLIHSLEWARYYTPWPADPATTTKSVVIDILTTSQYIDYRKSADVDADGSLSNAQSNAGGIGPFEFDKSVPTAMDALRDVLAYGRMPIEPEPLYLHVYGRSDFALRYEGDNRARNFVTSRMNDDSTTGEARQSFADRNAFMVEYTNSDGLTIFLPTAYDTMRVLLEGRRLESRSVSADDPTVADMIARVHLEDARKTRFSGTIPLGKTVWADGVGGRPEPSYTVRPMDTIIVNSTNTVLGPFPKIYIGDITVDLGSGETEITPHKNVDRAEILSQYLKV